MIRILAISVLVISSLTSIAQKEKETVDVIEFTGVIADNENKTLPYATIIVRNDGRGTISDFYGYFSIAVRAKDTIIVSYVGFRKHMLVIPETITGDLLYEHILLEADTIMLEEAVIYPWATYEQFKKAIVALEVPEDDYVRANRNLMLIQIQEIAMSMPNDGSLNYDYMMQQYYDKVYWIGQYPYISLMNPFAWAKFIKALKNGEFKVKPENTLDDLPDIQK